MKYLLISILFFVSAFAQAEPDYKKAVEILYPQSTDDQSFMQKLFDIVEIHKTQDPLMGGKGPSVTGFGLNKQPIAFIINEREKLIDLVLINWNLPVFSGLDIHSDLSEAIAAKAYILKNIDKKSVATQGENHDELANFSYINGSNFMEKQIKADNPDMIISEEFLNWKPHPDYMDKAHPLRVALDGLTLTLLNPSKEKFFDIYASLSDVNAMEALLESQGGYLNTILGMMVHEAFHVKEGNDNMLQNVARRSIDIDRKKLVEQLQSDNKLKALFASYINIVFSIGDSIGGSSQPNLSLMADLQVVIDEIKDKYSDAWKFIWDFEYTEGFAEYVSAQSMVAAGITSLPKQIEFQKTDPSNNFAYRTGSIGGLYLYYQLKSMPFSNDESLTMSVWEIIISQQAVPKSDYKIDEIVERNSTSSIDLNSEIDRVVEYLISTVENL